MQTEVMIMGNNNLQCFKYAQKRDCTIAYDEIKAGRKRSHWMWYIFPQVAGLGTTETSCGAINT
ncbi:Protein of unknown function [Mucilaginibacter pineti]|uniref:DUF1810 domain-containing protein n=1 Tax=Mucilaginibacter pineti TaxID=1391627 RepID=A0A1G7LAJ3_9SPHI|nr:DUF1810 family protein [Mucilaginibacter pineti]SDF46473.1 Protein of unknown function [Mucilaginibacter pineti]